MSSERARRIAHGTLFPAAEHAWTALAWLTGRALPATARPEPWTAAGGDVVVVAAHPDDETIGAGGVSALHTAAGDAVTIVVVTDGSASRAGGLPAAEMARRRRTEVEEAAEALGIGSLVCLGLPEKGWAAADGASAVRQFVERAKVVYAPSCVDYHPEHLAVARLVAGLVGEAQTVRVCELGVPLTPVLANMIADISSVGELKARAVAAHRTQRVGLAPFTRISRYRARMYGVEAAEVFWQLPGAAFARVTALGDWTGRPSPFRGIRGRPWLDPATALVGLHERLALRTTAREALG
jgi:LmbE family N-acetylglucosaminyl deacetylase